MKRLILSLAIIIATFGAVNAQDAPIVVKLDQTPGKFEKEGLTLKPGKYIFEVSNVGVDHELGFVIVPTKGGKEGAHIKDGYLKKAIKNGETSRSKVVELKAGIYNYFCPLNPTPHYKIVVED